MTLREFITQEMTLRKWSQHRLAQASGVSQAAIQKLLSPKIETTPDLDTLEKLAGAMGYPLITLVRLVKPDAADLDPAALVIASRIQRLPDDERNMIEKLVLGSALVADKDK